jgi:hypothetical protein
VEEEFVSACFKKYSFCVKNFQFFVVFFLVLNDMGSLTTTINDLQDVSHKKKETLRKSSSTTTHGTASQKARKTVLSGDSSICETWNCRTGVLDDDVESNQNLLNTYVFSATKPTINRNIFFSKIPFATKESYKKKNSKCQSISRKFMKTTRKSKQLSAVSRKRMYDSKTSKNNLYTNIHLPELSTFF